MLTSNFLGENNIRNKFLVVDDEISKNENDREDFVLDIGVAENLALFASSYEEAIETIKHNGDIAICFVDCRIPRNENSLYNTDFKNDISNIEWGIPLIPEINKVDEYIKIVVYSAYVSNSYLEDKAGNFKNVTGFYGKPNGIKHRKKLYLEALKIENDLQSSFPRHIVDAKPLFNYDSLDKDQRSLIQDKTKKIKSLLRRTSQDILNIGKYLTEVKESLNFGQFYPWLESELNWSPTSAARFMQVYRKFNSSKLKDFSLLPSVLYELSANKVPSEAIDEVVRMADSGETITLEVAKSIKKKYSSPKSKSSLKNSDSSNQNQPDLTNQLNLKSDTVVEKQKSTSQPVQEEKIKVADDSKQNIIGIVRRQNQWQIGQHRIFCGDPNSQKFLALLPDNKVSLVLNFPQDKDWKSQFSQYDSINTFYSRYKDLDYMSLLESVQKIVEITTSQQDCIIVSFIPHTDILRLLNKLECRSYIAEPNYEKCIALVNRGLD